MKSNSCPPDFDWASPMPLWIPIFHLIVSYRHFFVHLAGDIRSNLSQQPSKNRFYCAQGTFAHQTHCSNHKKTVNSAQEEIRLKLDYVNHMLC